MKLQKDVTFIKTYKITYGVLNTFFCEEQLYEAETAEKAEWYAQFTARNFFDELVEENQINCSITVKSCRNDIIEQLKSTNTSIEDISTDALNLYYSLIDKYLWWKIEELTLR